MPKDFSGYIKQFLEYLEIEKGRSINTINNYEFYLNRFSGWLMAQKITKLEDISLDIVRQYRLWLNRIVDDFGQSLKKNTQNYHLIAVRTFLKYLTKMDIKVLSPEKIELAKMPQRQVEFLEGADLDRLLDAPLNLPKGFVKRKIGEKPKQEPYSLIQLRDKAILEVLFSTGLRVSELASLKKDMINLAKDEFTIRGKGAKLRIVFLSEQSKYWIKQYIAKRTDMNPFLFICHDKASDKRDSDLEFCGLTPRSVQRILERYARIAGITKKVTPHTLRHSYATDLLINGADIRSVQSMLGHESITTTQVYTHITNQQLLKIHKQFHNKNSGKNL